MIDKERDEPWHLGIIIYNASSRIWNIFVSLSISGETLLKPDMNTTDQILVLLGTEIAIPYVNPAGLLRSIGGKEHGPFFLITMTLSYVAID